MVAPNTKKDMIPDAPNDSHAENTNIPKQSTNNGFTLSILYNINANIPPITAARQVKPKATAMTSIVSILVNC